jgi:uncharacterized protein (TIGR00375 family)
MLDIDERCVMIPAHAWTPWFAVFGSKSGYNSLEECFEELTPRIRAIETGLSSDPVMNRRLSMLDGITLISNSDAHSLENLAREANVFTFDRAEDITYDSLFAAIQTGDKKRFAYTIEFYPEEGKYHTDGHAACLVSFEPAETKRENGLCPKCGKPLTIGVLHRVDDLADRDIKNIPAETFIPHRYIVPLREIIAQVVGVKTASKKVVAEYERLTTRVGSEFFILLHAPLEMILKETSLPGVAEAIGRMRVGEVKVTPGYDGIFGVINMIYDEDLWFTIRQIPSVAKFIGRSDKPEQVQEGEILKVLNQSGEKVSKKIEVDFEVGESIKVISGPFRGYAGNIAEIYAEKGKMKVLISIFGRETPMEINFDQAEKNI